jgi:AcrR family transcriptional regulator
MVSKGMEMPRPRFNRLNAAKRQRILEAAAREFARDGYSNASLNQILEHAEISKGAAYYYFDDKADLFATTVTYYAEELMGQLDLSTAGLDAESFWPRITAFYEEQLSFFEKQPWAFGVLKAAARLSPEEVAGQPSMAGLIDKVEHSLQTVLQRGQELGVVRTDLPHELLAHLFIAVDDTLDHWLLANWNEREQEELQQVVRRVLDGMARFLAPPSGLSGQDSGARVETTSEAS